MSWLSNLPTPSQMRVLGAIKAAGEIGVAGLSQVLAVTESGVRQQLANLESSGLVEARPSRTGGPGRDRLLYRITPRSDDLFPDQSNDELVNLLEFLRTREPGLVEVWLEQRMRGYATSDHAGATGDLPARLAHVAVRAAARGMQLTVDAASGDAADFRVVHCPMLQLARRLPGVCEAERAAMQAAMPGYALQLLATRVEGEPHCAFHVSREPLAS